MRKFGQVFIFILLINVTPLSAATGGYMNFPWETTFPTIEKRFPGISFILETRKVTQCEVNHQDGELLSRTFRFFGGGLISATHEFGSQLLPCQNEFYLNSFAQGLGKRFALKTKGG